MNTSRKILLSIGAIGAAASIAGLGTFATFTDTDSATATITAGTVTIDLADAGANNRLNVGASGMVPGDSLQRRVVLTNDGNQGLASVTLTTTAAASTLLTSDAGDGLQMKIEKCGGGAGWRESASTPYTYTCDALLPGDNAGTRSTVLARRAILGSTIALSGMSSLTAGASDDMVVTVDLPSSADNNFQGLQSVITYAFNATQRAATAK
jgi:predicted ribosomally synthesized peptide with SipW-like signal peptide